MTQREETTQRSFNGNNLFIASGTTDTDPALNNDCDGKGDAKLAPGQAESWEKNQMMMVQLPIPSSCVTVLNGLTEKM
ncbi:MAG: hypothetical protein ACLT46_06305 [Hungatella sp.]